MANKVLGRISTVLAVNAKPLQSGLNLAKGELETFASTVKSRLTSAGNSAERALKGMYTDFQRLERAVKAANSQQLNLKVQNPKAILDVARATERIAKPVGDAQKQFSALSQTVQSALLPVLQSGQKQAENFFDAISRGVKVTERDFANTESRVNRMTEAIRRAAEASQATRGLATGQELRFQNPEFLRSTSRAAQLQQQAAQLSPEAISSRGIVSLIGQQKLAADEAERLRATLERTIATRNGDQESARRAYTQQVAYLDQVTDRLERQIQLERQANQERAAASNRSFTLSRGPQEQRGLGLFGSNVGTEAERAIALARQVSAQFAELPESAQQGLRGLAGIASNVANGVAAGTSNANDLLAVLQRLQRRIDETAAATRAFTIVQAPQEQRGLGLFGSNVGTEAERAIALARQVSAQFAELPESAQQGLRGLAGIASNVANGVAAGTSNANDLLAVLQRLQPAVEAAGEAADRTRATFPTSPGDPEGPFGPPRPFSDLTGNRDPRTRVLGQLGQEVGDLRNRLRGVGETLAGDIGPTVDNLTTRFQNMARQGVGVAAEDARRLAQEVAGINAALNNRQSIGERFESSFGGAGRAGLSLGVDERSLRAIGGQIEFVQGRLSALGQEARGPVIAALDALRTRANQLFQGGAIDTTEGRRELQLLREELARTLSAAGGGSRRQIAEQLRRAGDVGRGGFDNFGLAIQQAAFAIDDFFSVTGGLDQRIRAIGNNVSQLGFVLGGWQGLVAGVAASIGAQLVVGLVKWYNAGVSSESQTKAINEALSQQKTIVDQLAQSFESLADSLIQRGFSPATREAQGFAKSLRDIAKEQKELQVARFTLLDPTAFQQSTQANELQRRLESTTDAGQTLALLRARAQARASARAAATDAAGRPATFDDAVNAIGARPANRAEATNAAFGAVLDGLQTFLTAGMNPVAARNIGLRTNATAARTQFEAARGDRRAEIRAVEARLDELQPLAQQGTGSFLGFITGQSSAAAAASREFARLTSVLASLNSQLDSDSALVGFLKAVNQATLDISQAQEQVADAIRGGVPGAVVLGSSLERLNSEIEASSEAIRQAEKRLRDRGDAATVGDREARDEVVRRETDRINRSRAARDRALDRAADLTRERIVDPQRLFDARRSRAEANLSESGLSSGATARRIRELEARRSEVESRLQREGGLANPFAARRASRDLDAINREMAAIEATTMALRRFTEAISRAEQEARSNLDSARQREEDVRRQSLAPAGLATQADRRQAERDLEEQRQANQRVEDAASRARLRLEREANDPNNPLAATFARLREIEELAQGGQLTPELIEERRRLQRQVDAAVQQDASVVAARDDSTRIAERQASEQRGRDLLLRPGERAARELRQSVADIRAATKQNIDRAIREGRPQDVDREWQRGREAERRALLDQMRNAAPTIFGLADSVANAVLQGPSRAALQATDVSTVEGSRELTRLLRGDDAARDQANLVELQREANRLLDIIANAPAPVAN